MKKGISLLVLMVAITVMAIVISTASVMGASSINAANYDEYIATIQRVVDDVNAYYLINKELPVTGEVLSASAMGTEFMGSVAQKGDESDTLLVVNVDLLGDSTIKKGRGKVETKDVFLVSKNSHNVYYLQGYQYKNKVYFSN